MEVKTNLEMKGGVKDDGIACKWLRQSAGLCKSSRVCGLWGHVGIGLHGGPLQPVGDSRGEPGERCWRREKSVSQCHGDRRERPRRRESSDDWTPPIAVSVCLSILSFSPCRLAPPDPSPENFFLN
ncbi:hypothetical protein SKAU_G00296850 [Synaphobranchus kaupii]|uniref:Uncharacterized protein n=1 Tax=Synaphobranchus kaupii TaxID=118154 RepID=A0A9Q1ILX0_SYNKA|nr:hypothetical protein SKAU_G00296850 [Synaphobranchus kaupii]